jgi:hypothetical protein
MRQSTVATRRKTQKVDLKLADRDVDHSQNRPTRRKNHVYSLNSATIATLYT